MRFAVLLFFLLPRTNTSPLLRLETRDPSQPTRTQVEEQNQNTGEHAVIAEIFNPTESPIVTQNAPAPDPKSVPVSTAKSQETHLSTVILEPDFKIEAEKMPVEVKTEKTMAKAQIEHDEGKRPVGTIGVTSECQPIEDFPDGSEEIKDGMKEGEMTLLLDCPQMIERINQQIRKQDEKNFRKKMIESVMKMEIIQDEPSPSTAPNQSDLGKKPIDVTLNKLEQPAQESLNNGFTEEEELPAVPAAPFDVQKNLKEINDVEPSPSTAPNRSDPEKKHIDVTLNELEQPAQVSLNNKYTVEEEELPQVPPVPFDEQKDLKEINDLDEDLGVELDGADCLDKARFLQPAVVNPAPPRRLQMESEENETEEEIEKKEHEFVFRVVVYFLSLLGDVVEDKPSTWQKIIAGVQCVLRDCREALPHRPTERPLIGEGSFIIRRARESLCSCHIPGVTDVE